jgi:pentatricopeptide repeat protein
VRPDVVTYTALIAAYAKDNNFAAADHVPHV